MPNHKHGQSSKAAEDGKSVLVDDAKKQDRAICICSMQHFHESLVGRARRASSDLLRAVHHLATKVPKWTSTCDIMFNRLMGYILNAKHLRTMGWVGDSGDQVYPHLDFDVYFVGDIDTQRSTSGFHSVARGANPFFYVSRQQGADLRVACHT